LKSAALEGDRAGFETGFDAGSQAGPDLGSGAKQIVDSGVAGSTIMFRSLGPDADNPQAPTTASRLAR
jgi:hypothetical protein